MPAFADEAEVCESVHIAAAPHDVWPLVVDVDLPARFSTEFKGAEWLDGAEPALGARFKGTNELDFMGTWSTTCTVTGFDPARLFEWTVEDLDTPVAVWRFELEPVGDHTVLTQTARVGLGPSGLAIAVLQNPENEHAIVAGRLEQWRGNMRRTLEGIRDLAEGGGA